MICVERPLGVGEALEILHTETNPFDATLGYRIEPAAPGSGLEFRLGVGAAVSPLHLYGKLELFAEDMERVVRETFEVGLHGWQVTDCVVTLAQTAYGVADGPPSKSSEPSSTCRPTASAPCSRRSAGPALRRPAARVAAPAARADLGHSASSRRVRTATGRCTGIRRCAAGRGRAR